MNIAVNSRMYVDVSSGIHTYIKHAFPPLVDRGHQVTYIQPHISRTLGHTITPQKRFNFLGAPWFDHVSAGHHRIQDLDIFHGASFIVPVGLTCKQVVTVHDIAFETHPEFYSRQYRTYYGVATRRSVRIADHIITVSDQTKLDLIQLYGIQPEKISRVYLGVDTKFYQPNSTSLSYTQPFFFAVTTHPSRKNIPRMVEVWSQNTACQTTLMIIAGTIDKDEQSRLESIARRFNAHDRLRFLGFISQESLISHYQQALAFVFPSYYEGFGLPVLEAMAGGGVVMHSTGGSLKELARHPECTFDPYDNAGMDDVFNRIMKLGDLQKKTIGAQNRLFAQKFNWSHHVDQVETIYKSLV